MWRIYRTQYFWNYNRSSEQKIKFQKKHEQIILTVKQKHQMQGIQNITTSIWNSNCREIKDITHVVYTS